MILAQLLGIVVSACMAHGWQLEDETGLQVRRNFYQNYFSIFFSTTLN